MLIFFFFTILEGLTMKFLIAFVLSSLLFLSGCGPIYRTDYTYKPPHSNTGLMCINQCMMAKNSCSQLCEMRSDNCKSQARQEAMTKYEMYRSQQNINHLPIKKTIDDFDDSFFRCQSDSACRS